MKRKLVLKNLAICTGLSLTMIISCIGGLPMFNSSVMAATNFRDDGAIREYAREAIEELIATGGIKGYEDNTFRPQGNLTHLEAISMIASSIDPTGEKSEAYREKKGEKDVIDRRDFWDSVSDVDIRSIWGGKGEKLISLVPQALATPGNYNESITRKEFAEMVVWLSEKTLGYEEFKIDEEVYDIYGIGIGEEAAKLCSAGIMTGVRERDRYDFKGNEDLTREQAATIVHRLINKGKRESLDKSVLEARPVVEPMEYNLNDPSRRRAVAGDKVMVNGKEIVVEEKYGVVGADQPIALDLGIVFDIPEGQVGSGTAEKFRTVQNNNDCWLPEGILNTYKGTLDTYVINPETGEGHFSSEWDKMESAYIKSIKNPEIGKVYTFGLGGWCKLQFHGIGFSTVDRPSWL